MNRTNYLSIGSNQPPRKTYIEKCLVQIKQTFPDQFSVSSLYLTAPYLGVVQPFYYNCCVRFISEIQPYELLKFCAILEKKLGRTRGKSKWQSRTIDVDILLMSDECIYSPDLTLPHYDLQNRDFVLIPLLELDRSLVHPVSGKSFKELLNEIPGKNRTAPFKLHKQEI